jgi:hypothetical protein
MAASYFNRLAEELSLPYTATAASAEDPYDAVPEPVAEFLEREGFDVRDFTPRPAEPRDLCGATRTVSIGCELAGPHIERWDDVPAASDDLEGSAAAIRRHVAALVEELRGRN